MPKSTVFTISYSFSHINYLTTILLSFLKIFITNFYKLFTYPFSGVILILNFMKQRDKVGTTLISITQKQTHILKGERLCILTTQFLKTLMML